MTGSANSADPGPYRAPGRESPDAPVPPPSRQTLLRPLRWGAISLLVTIGPLIAVNLVAHKVFGDRPTTRLTPWVIDVMNVIALAHLASFGVVGLAIASRVRPLWSGMSRLARSAYVSGVLVVHAFLVAVVAGFWLWSRFESGLFDPTVRDVATSPDGSIAYLFRSWDYGCAHDVYVAPSAWSPIMTRTLRVHRKDCDEPPPHLHWSDGAQLEDPAGQRLEEQPPDYGHGHWFGC